MSHFFAFLSRMRYIERWGLMKSTDRENIAEHSLQVAMVAHGLCVIKNTYFGGTLDCDRAATLSLYHDAGEILTGDLPTPIKYDNPAIRDAYHALEEVSKKKLLSLLPEQMQGSFEQLFFDQPGQEELWRIIKVADKICAYCKCLEELKAGNREFARAAESLLRWLSADPAPETAYFMEQFLPSFSLTLDEQQS